MGPLMPRPRLPDWKTRLGDYVTEAFQLPFEPGHTDCAMFVAGAVHAMTGVDFAAGFRGRYSTLEGGIKALRTVGWHSHIAVIAAHFEEVHPAFAGAGDIAMLDDPTHPTGMEALGIVQGEHVYAIRADGLGVGIAPRTDMLRAWRV